MCKCLPGRVNGSVYHHHTDGIYYLMKHLEQRCSWFNTVLWSHNELSSSELNGFDMNSLDTVLLLYSGDMFKAKLLI